MTLREINKPDGALLCASLRSGRLDRVIDADDGP
jgi:hypothetical protein